MCCKSSTFECKDIALEREKIRAGDCIALEYEEKYSALSRGAVNELQPEYDSLPAGGTIISGLTDEEG